MIAKVIPIRRMPSNLSCLSYNTNNLTGELKVGQLVAIPLRKKIEFGIVSELNKQVDLENKKLKDIKEIIIKEPLITESLLNFYQEISEFYNTSLGFILKTSLLPLKKTKLKKISETLPSFNLFKKTTAIQKPIFTSLNTKKEDLFFLKKILNQKGQNLILVPDISDIQSIEVKLKKITTKEFLIITGDLGEKDYFDFWLKVRTNKNIIVLGTRKSLFLPWQNLQNILMFDEGNPNYKSWEMLPRFHTRDVVLMLSKYTKAKLYLISSTPSVETYYFAKKSVYKERGEIINLSPPAPIFIDISQEKKYSNNVFLSESIFQEMKLCNGDIFIYLNKKGSSKLLICKNCQYIPRCSTCQKPMTYFERKNELHCLFCQKNEPEKKYCPQCNESIFKMISYGTEKVESEISKEFPQFQTIVIDAENTKNLINIKKYKDKNKIIIGTKYAWSQIEWDKIKLMIFADPDVSLTIPEFKSIEFLWQEIRSIQKKLNKTAKFIIQTSFFDHHLYQGLYNPHLFYKKELTERQFFNYPPYKYLTRLIYCGENNTLKKEEDNLIALLKPLTKTLDDVKIIGPFSANKSTNKSNNCSVIVLKISYKNYKKIMKFLMSQINDKWKIDPNPNQLLINV